MIDRELDIPTLDGVMNTFVTHPEEGGPHPVVLFFMDAPGKREELHDMARRLGSAGYYVMLPNLYYRRARDWVMQPTDAARQQMFEHMESLTRPRVLTDTAALLAFAARDVAARSGPVGAVGYCMSGPFVFWAAHAHPDRIAAAASFHGVRLFTDLPDSPHLLAKDIPAELYVGCAQTDHWAPPEMIRGLEAHLDAVRPGADARWRVEWYPGTLHGFVFPQRAGMYDKAAAERHWERLHALFRRTL
jgi:carboxymethylenebutenolidase